MHPPCQWAGGRTTMLITSSISFHFVHDGKEEFDLGEKPVEVSEEAYNHMAGVYGQDLFKILDEKETEKETVTDKLKKKK